MYYIGVRDGKKKMEEGKNKPQHLGFRSHNILDHPQDIHKIWRLRLSLELRNLWQQIWLERTKNGQLKGMVSRRRLILCYTIQLVILNIGTNFQNPTNNYSSREESLTEFSACITLEWEREKRKNGKRRQNKSRHLGCLSHIIRGNSHLKTGCHGSRECDRKFDWRERKMDKI